MAKLEPFFYESKYSIEYPPKENIILIIVESLLSFPTDLKINGIEITPTLNKLVEKGAYYNTYRAQYGAVLDAKNEIA